MSIAERLGQLRSKLGPARLIAVSKTKPVSALIEAYQAGQRDFGENYPGELRDKAKNGELRELCPELRWHFIGTLQKKAMNQVIKAEGLVSIQTITSLEMIDQIAAKLNDKQLDVMLQVNTSREEQKGGFLDDDDIVQAVQHVQTKHHLRFQGLMTIGSAENSKLSAETGQDNPDFTRLVELKQLVAAKCHIPADAIELSMGMSTDYEQAIKQGADIVRVGSAIFGAREVKK